MDERRSGRVHNCTVAVATGEYDKKHPQLPPLVDPFQIPAPSASPIHTNITVTLHPTLVRSLPGIQASSCAVPCAGIGMDGTCAIGLLELQCGRR